MKYINISSDTLAIPWLNKINPNETFEFNWILNDNRLELVKEKIEKKLGRKLK